MKIEIEVCGFTVAAKTDYVPGINTPNEEAAKIATFIRLCNEARAVAKEYIDAKFNNDKKGDGK